MHNRISNINSKSNHRTFSITEGIKVHRDDCNNPELTDWSLFLKSPVSLA